MSDRTAWEAAREKRQAVKAAEDSGQVADSMDVRKALMDRVQSGEISLEDAQRQLRKIKSSAKRNGKVTRSQAFNQG